MAQQFVDGFDNYNSILAVWDSTTGAPGTFGSSSPALRFSNPAGCVSQWLLLPGSKIATKNLLSSQATLVYGIAFQLTALPTGMAAFMGFMDSGSNQVALSVNLLGQLQFVRGNTGIGAATANNTIQPNVWYEVAVVVTIDPSVGVATCYLNGNPTPAINSTGLNTRSTGNSSANQVFFGTQNGSNGLQTTQSAYWDDVYVWDTTGSTQNAWPGNDARVLTKLPTGAGNYTNWTPTGLGTNWQCVSQNPPNTSDYVSNNTPGTKDSYALTAVGLTVAPYSVTVRQSIYKDDANTHTAQALIRSSSTDGTGTAYNVNSSPTFVDTVFPNDPATSSPWLGAAADAAIIGVVETS